MITVFSPFLQERLILKLKNNLALIEQMEQMFTLNLPDRLNLRELNSNKKKVFQSLEKPFLTKLSIQLLFYQFKI